MGAERKRKGWKMEVEQRREIMGLRMLQSRPGFGVV